MKLYDIIYADPPWRYDFSENKKNSIEHHYPTMVLEDIKKMIVPAAKNSILYLWATAPKLPEALEVMKAWGFTYKTQAIWDKEAIGMGYWFRIGHELLLVGVKGKMSPPVPADRIRSIIRIKRKTSNQHTRSIHSEKPLYIARMINKWFPGKTKIELFARDHLKGFDTWGKEVGSTHHTLDEYFKKK